MHLSPFFSPLRLIWLIFVWAGLFFFAGLAATPALAADPVLTKTASTPSAVVGDAVAFTIKARNATAVDLVNITVTDALPAGMIYGGHLADLGSVAASGQAVTWTIPLLPAGYTAQMTLAAQLTMQGSITNTVTSGAAAASATVQVLPRARTHYRMDETAGSWNGTPGEVLDSGSTNLPGRRLVTSTPTATNTLAPSPTIASANSSVVGEFCNAGTFDGKAVVFIPYNANFNYTKTLSASAWIYPRQYPSGANPSDVYSILSNDVNYEFHINSTGNLFWWWNGGLLTSAKTIPLNQWTHVAITFNATTGRQYIYINGIRDANTNNWTGALTQNTCGFYIGGDIDTASTCPASPRAGRNFRGMIDEVKLYNYELTPAEVAADMTVGRSCSNALDHIQLEYDGAASVCSPKTVTVKACIDSACKLLYPGTVTVKLTPAGWAGGDVFTFSGGVASRQLSVTTAQTVTLGTASVSPAAGVTTCVNTSDGAQSCSLDFSGDSCAFDAVEPGGGVNSPLFTKLSNTAFNVDVLAMSSGAIDGWYAGTVYVDLVDASLAACPTGAGLTAATGLVFNWTNNGRRTLSLSYPQAARNVRVRVRPQWSSSYACSSDNFAIRPQQFNVSSSNMSNTALTGAPAAAAGTAFNLTASAVGTPPSTLVTTGYDSTPALDAAQTVDHAGVAIATGALAGAFGAGDGTKASGNGFTYADVGNIQLKAGAVVDSAFTAVDQPASGIKHCIVGSASNSLAIDPADGKSKYGCNIANVDSPKLGRWRPDHFSFAGTLTPACPASCPTPPCDGFTYMGDDHLGVNLTFKAHAKGPAAAAATDPVVSRYTFATPAVYPLALLAGATLAGDDNGNAIAISRLTSPALPAMPTTAWNAGQLIINDTYAFAKNATPDGSYENFTLKASLSDPDGGAGLVGAAQTNTTRLRHGRLWLNNAVGSEFMPLPVPLETQFWDKTAWKRNTLDNCTVLNLPTSANGGLIFYGATPRNQLASGQTTATLGGSATATGGVIAGWLPLVLSKPGAGHFGYVDVPTSVLLGAGSWLDAAVPSARACFGTCGPRSSVIYWRTVH